CRSGSTHSPSVGALRTVSARASRSAAAGAEFAPACFQLTAPRGVRTLPRLPSDFPCPARVAELVDALVSGTSGYHRGGSSPLPGTSNLFSPHLTRSRLVSSSLLSDCFLVNFPLSNGLRPTHRISPQPNLAAIEIRVISSLSKTGTRTFKS